MKQNSFLVRILVGQAACLIFALPSHAVSSRMQNLVSASGGISSPSAETAVFQNPAGIAFNDGFNVTAQGGPNVLRGGISGGGGAFGAIAGVSRNTETEHDQAFYGMGVRAPSARFGLGISGFTDLSDGNATSINAGAFIQPMDNWRFGLTTIGIDDGINEIGAGLSYDVSSGFSVVVDAAMNSDFSGMDVQPGIVVGSPRAALTLSYGIPTEGENVSSFQLHDGFSAGAGFRINPMLLMQVYYEQLDEFYAALTYRL